MNLQAPWLPRSVQCLRGYSLNHLVQDLIAGVTVGLVALPLAMAFGIASGVPPQAGLYTAVVAGFLISALGGSRVQIGGPTGAFVVIVAGIVAKFGLSGLGAGTLMAGVLLVLMGLTGLGSAVKFIPRPVIIGFTNGIALLIASTQIKDFLGLKTSAVPSEFLPRMAVLAEHIASVHWPHGGRWGARRWRSFLLWPRMTGEFPGSILALLAWHGCGGTACICMWKPSAASSAAFRGGSRRSHCRIPCGAYPSAAAVGLYGGAAGARSRACSRRWLPTA